MKQKLLLLLVTLFTATLSHAYDFAVDGIYYNKNGENVTVTYGGYDYTGNIVIPERVSCIGITYSVTSIGNYAFSGCSGLTSVTIPNTVTSIGEAAFEYCSGLTEVTIPNSVTSIGDSAFSHCSGLKAFYGKYASDDNRCLILGSTLWAFAPSGLSAYTIPISVTSIGLYAFYNCSGLTSVTIPNSVTSIGYFAFGYCSGLTSVTIPNSVTSIGDWAFCDCCSLTSVTVENEDPANISLGYAVFYEVPISACTLYVPYGSEDLYSNAPVWKDFWRVKGFASGVDDVYMDEKTDPNAPYYDLMGRRVENPTPGFYIHNGKKMIVK